MQVDHYSVLTLTGVTFDGIAERVAEWLVPAAVVERRRRAATGMPQTWVASQLRQSVDLIGNENCRLQGRRSRRGDLVILRYWHRDADDVGVSGQTSSA
jgi:hypothetical protein